MRKTIVFIFLTLIFLSCENEEKESKRISLEKPSEFLNSNGDKENWITLKEGQKADRYYRKNNKIYCGETSCDAREIKGVDISTFEVCLGSGYAKDRNNVYYPLEVVCIDYADCGSCFCSEYLVENANAEKFKYLSKGYATDGKKVFYDGKEIRNVDPKTFRVTTFNRKTELLEKLN